MSRQNRRMYNEAWRRKIRKVILVVMRVDRHGNLCMSKPCKDCIDVLNIVGVGKVMYSTGDMHKPFVLEHTSMMCNTFRTSGTLNL
jgi:hypothetical protein